MPSASSPNPFVYRAVTLTDAQVKALAVTPVVLIPATETLGYVGVASTLPIIVAASAFSNTLAGAYTNIAVGATMTLAWGSDQSFNIANASTAQGSAASLSVALGNTGIRWLAFPLTDQDGDNNLNGGLIDNSVVLSIGNVGQGALTGGNVANALTVKLAYTVTHIPT